MMPVNDFELINYEQYSDSLYKFSTQPPEFLPNENSMYKILVDWSNLSGFADCTYVYTLTPITKISSI